MNELIQYKCKSCNKTFFLLDEEVTHSERESIYITCPFNGKHKNIKVTNKYGNIKEIKACMEDQDIFKKEKGRWKKI